MHIRSRFLRLLSVNNQLNRYCESTSPSALTSARLHLQTLQVYDVSGFIEKHPGGARQLLLGAGRDITMVFESYHHFNISKYRLMLIAYVER
jgi:hypothetical protein